MTMTFEQWLAATDGGAGPTRHWPLSDTSGTTMAATIGGINGTYQNTADLELNIIDRDGRSGSASAAAGAPGHATVATALQSAAFTAMPLVQFDLVKSKHVLLTTGGGTVAGQFSVELIDDGAGGLKPRVWSVNASNEAVVYIGSNPARCRSARPARYCMCAARTAPRKSGASPPGRRAQIALTLSSGTPPGSWSAHPAGTWYLGAWSTGVDALSGVARSLALWDVALSASDISALGSISPQIQNVVWARAVMPARSQ